MSNSLLQSGIVQLLIMHPFRSVLLKNVLTSHLFDGRHHFSFVKDVSIFCHAVREKSFKEFLYLTF